MLYTVMLINGSPEYVSRETDLVKLEVLRKARQAELDKQDGVKSKWTRKRVVTMHTVEGDEPEKELVHTPREQIAFIPNDSDVIDLKADDYEKN